MENELYTKIKINCNIFGLNKDDKIVIAVSGGLDSIALMMLLRKYYNLYVVTFDHGIRFESKQEVLFVSNLCKTLNIKCEIINIKTELDNTNNLEKNILSLDKSNIKNNNFQNKARDIRYFHLTNIAKKHNIKFIATGHHLDDLTENFMLKILRAGGNFAFSTNNILELGNLKIIRPVFNIAKEELKQFLINNNISWMEDASNFSDKYKRNQIRIGLNAFFEASKIEKRLFQNNLLKTLECIENSNAMNIVLIKKYTKQIYYDIHGFVLIFNFKNINQDILFFLIKEILQNFNIAQEIRAYKIYNLLNNLKQNSNIKHTFFGICVENLDDNLIFYLLPNFKKINHINIINNLDSLQFNSLKLIQIKTNFKLTKFNYFHKKNNTSSSICNIDLDNSNNLFKIIWLNIFELYFIINHNSAILDDNLSIKNANNIINNCNVNYNFNIYDINSDNFNNSIDNSSINKLSKNFNNVINELPQDEKYIIDYLTQEEYNELMKDEQFKLKIKNYFLYIEKILLKKNIKKIIKSIMFSLPIIKTFNFITNEKKIAAIPHLEYFIET
ncbi:MAG: tRNA lysidine(34) synthetase TilS [Rickettsiales bacterium]